MPFQPGAIQANLWRYQELNANSQVTNEWYVNLGIVDHFSSRRVVAPVYGGQTTQVSFWFHSNALTGSNPDLTLSGPPAVAFLADMDSLFQGQ